MIRTGERLTDATAWKRSRRGNLWRVVNGLTLCVFVREDGRFAWSIADQHGPRFSPRTFKTEARALRDLADEMEAGE